MKSWEKVLWIVVVLEAVVLVGSADAALYSIFWWLWR